MTTVGMIEATTAGIGEELNDLFGYASTRLTANVNPETQLQTAINTMDYDGNVTVTLTSGTFSVSVSGGMRLRILSGALIEAEALIATRDSGIQLTLASTFPNPVSFTTENWEIVIDADDELLVENAIEFADPASPGRVVLDGVVYFYTGKTANSFTGITYDDGTGLIKNGVSKQHKSLALVSDYSKAKSALDIYRRSFLVAYATGKDLDIIGRNLGVERPPELIDDDVYRKLISAVAYAPRGTIFAMEQVLDVLLGETIISSGTKNAIGTGDPYIVQIVSGTYPTGIEGFRFRVKSGYLTDRTIRIAERVDSTHIRLNIPMEDDFYLESWEITDPNWEIFEDLTLGSLHHACEVFFRRKDSQEEQFVGKAFLDGPNYVPLASTTSINFTGQGHLKVAGVTLKNEGGIQKIAEGTVAASTTANSVDGKVVTSSSAFPSYIKPGDIFQITNGMLAGKEATILSRDSSSSITLGLLDGFENGSDTDSGTIGTPFMGIQWQILRTKTNCRYYKPSSESRPEYTGDTGTATWTYIGASEVTRAQLGSDGNYGSYLRLVPATNIVGYRRTLRILPESNASVEMLLDVQDSLISTVGSGKQICCALSDGERVLAWGANDSVGNLQSRVGLINVTNGLFIGSPAIWSDVTNTKYIPGLAIIKLVKTARDTVRLYKQSFQGHFDSTEWKFIDEVPYSDFPTVAAWNGAAPYATNDHEVAWGTLEAGHSNQTIVKYVDWSVDNVEIDFWNFHSTADTSANNTLHDSTAPFLSGDVGRRVFIRDFGDVNSSGGNALGLWQVASRPDTSHITLTGEQKWRGYFDLTNRRALFVRGESPFIWPDHRGHSIQIIDGVNIGTYPIVAVIDPYTGEDCDLDEGVPETVADSVNWTSKDLIQRRIYSYIIEVNTGADDFDDTSVECSWRLVPNFATSDSGIEYEIVDASTDTAGTLTLRQAMPFAAGTVVSVYASKVLSAYLFHEREFNELTPPDTYKMYPFYFWDAFGYVKTIMEIVKAAGIHLDFINLFRDEAGLHILNNTVSGSEGSPTSFVEGGTTGFALVTGSIFGTPVVTVNGTSTVTGEGNGSISGTANGTATVDGIIFS